MEEPTTLAFAASCSALVEKPCENFTGCCCCCWFLRKRLLLYVFLKVCPSVCREGLAWVDINWMDNGECLDLIEKVRYEEGVNTDIYNS